MFSNDLDPDEQRRIRRCIARRNTKIFEALQGWRLEGSMIDKIEENIREHIGWFDIRNKLIGMCAERILTHLLPNFGKIWHRKPKFLKCIGCHCDLEKDDLLTLFCDLRKIQEDQAEKENLIKANTQDPETNHVRG